MARKKVDRRNRKLFKDEQINMFEKSYEEELEAKRSQKVECLGMTFENDNARREHFLGILREKLKDPKFRKIEGFPIGEDENILAISDPPYYTACPNPWIEDFIEHYGKLYNPATDDYRREPFASDVSEGKNDPIYNAHSYHTKVPHKAIMRYILHYTEPGDVVFDGFCGTGMTGVAAQLCGDKSAVESLGLRVDKNGTIYREEKDEDGKAIWKPFSKLGSRRALLNDLSPAATFITYNYNTPIDIRDFEIEAKRILREVEEECGWMYETLHSDGKTKGKINYTVWSDVFVCPECAGEVVFWEEALEKEFGKFRQDFKCPHCSRWISKTPTNPKKEIKKPLNHRRPESSKLDRAWVTKYDKIIGKTIRQAKQVPVLVNYSVGKKRFEKEPDANDLTLIENIKKRDIPYWFPTDPVPEGDKTGEPLRVGITHVHHFYTNRNLSVMAAYGLHAVKSHLSTFLFGFLNTAWHATRMRRFNQFGGDRPLSGTIYIPSIPTEGNMFDVYKHKIKQIKRFIEVRGNRLPTWCAYTSSTGSYQGNENSVDYLFVDPPFGGNLMYSELNFLWESWLKVFTNNVSEAIENKTQGKKLQEYQNLMTSCFKECIRILKPGRWMTVEFHNSKNSVWNAIQESLQYVGFVIADVRTIDKKQGSVNQYTSAGAVKQDLVISAYKPNGGLEERFKLTAGTEDGAWDFVRTHLKQLPVFVSKNGQVEIIAERQNYLLFDRMVAFHVQRGVTVPLSAAEFYAGLEQRFPPRDGMYFLPDQAAEYDKKRMTVKEVLQLQLFVSDEASGIQWLKQQLTKKPQSFQDIHPQFLKELGGWQKHEKALELSELLEQNFLRYDGKGEVPSQIHSYLSTNFKELRNLAKDEPSLCVKGKDRWYVPDPNKAGDLEKLRERALLREFREYHESKQKRLKVFRLEAVRAGFKKAWQEKDYKTIIEVAQKIKENVLQEDPKLLMFYDQALTRAEHI
jgi:DNA modification methylase